MTYIVLKAPLNSNQPTNLFFVPYARPQFWADLREILRVASL